MASLWGSQSKFIISEDDSQIVFWFMKCSQEEVSTFCFDLLILCLLGAAGVLKTKQSSIFLYRCQILKEWQERQTNFTLRWNYHFNENLLDVFLLASSLFFQVKLGLASISFTVQTQTLFESAEDFKEIQALLFILDMSVLSWIIVGEVSCIIVIILLPLLKEPRQQNEKG